MAQRKGKKKAQQEAAARRRWLVFAGRGLAVLAFILVVYWIANPEKTANVRVTVQGISTDDEGVTTVQGRFETSSQRGASVLLVRFPFKFKEPPEVKLETQTGTAPPSEVLAVKPSHFRVRAEASGRFMVFYAKGKKLL